MSPKGTVLLLVRAFDIFSSLLMIDVKQLKELLIMKKWLTSCEKQVLKKEWKSFWLIDDRLRSAILRSLEQTHCARIWFYMSD